MAKLKKHQKAYGFIKFSLSLCIIGFVILFYKPAQVEAADYRNLNSSGEIYWYTTASVSRPGWQYETVGWTFTLKSSSGSKTYFISTKGSDPDLINTTSGGTETYRISSKRLFSRAGLALTVNI